MDSVDGSSSEPSLLDSTPATCALNERVALNIGGTLYRTTRGTLCRCEGSMLERMFNRSPDDPLRAVADSSGQYFIDRDGVLFRHILNYLRDGRLAIAFDFSDYDQLIAEADFYGLDALVRELRTRRDRWVSQLEAPLPSLVAGDWETIYVEVKDQVTYFKGWHVQTSLTGPLNKLCGLAPFRDELSPCLFSSASNMHVTIPPASPRSPPQPTQPQPVPAGSPATSPASEFYVQTDSHSSVNTRLANDVRSAVANANGGLPQPVPTTPPQPSAPSAPSISSAALHVYTAWRRGDVGEVYIVGGDTRLAWATRLRAAGWRLCATTACAPDANDQTLLLVDKWCLHFPLRPSN